MSAGSGGRGISAKSRGASSLGNGTRCTERLSSYSDVRFRTERKVEGLEQIEYVSDVHTADGEMRLRVDGEHIGALLEHITPYGIRSLQCMPPTLEELFMRHYETEAHE